MHTTNIRKALAALALLSPLLLVGGAQPASAGAGLDGLKVVGGGTITPGLDICAPPGVQKFQTVDFDGTAVAVGTHANIYQVHFRGASSIQEDLCIGRGDGTLVLDPLDPNPLWSTPNAIHYDRTVHAVTISINPGGTVYFGPGTTHATTTATGIGNFVPTSVFPTTTYILTAEFVCA